MIWLDIEFISEICIGQGRISRQHMSLTIYWEYFRYNIPPSPNVFTTLYTIHFTDIRNLHNIQELILHIDAFLNPFNISDLAVHLNIDIHLKHNSIDIRHIIVLINQVMYCVPDVFSSSSVLSHLFIQEMYQESWRIYFYFCVQHKIWWGLDVGRRVKIIWS